MLSSDAMIPSPSQGHLPSPVPYLIAGLAAMLALIACALTVLICSYWKMMATHPHQDENIAPPPLHEMEDEKVVVIMAGEEKPTFLAKIQQLSGTVHQESAQS
ncbi:hypothetical protein SUGI_0605030 [Cryptomeria japonica]|nr:hypothetical protein SUGI_0605030 [Cryptomeria japonica]